MERDQLLKDERQRLAAEATRLNKLSAELAVKRAETVSCKNTHISTDKILSLKPVLACLP